MNKENTFILRVYCDNGLVNVYSTKGVFLPRESRWTSCRDNSRTSARHLRNSEYGSKKDSFTMGLPKNCCI